MNADRMNCCSRCCALVCREMPEGDHRVRDICCACRTAFHANPKIVVGTVLEREGRILMCRRAIEADVFAERQMPWKETTFASAEVTLHAYFADLRRGRFEIHALTLGAHAANQSSRR